MDLQMRIFMVAQVAIHMIHLRHTTLLLHRTRNQKRNHLTVLQLLPIKNQKRNPLLLMKK